MRHFFSGHITRTVLVLVFLAVLPCLLTFVRFALERNKADRRAMEQRVEEAARVLGKERIVLMERMRSMLSTLALLPGVREADSPDILAVLLRNIRMAHPHVANLLLTDKQGRILQCGAGSAKGFDLNALPFFRNARKNLVFTVSPYMTEIATGLPVVYCAYPIFENGLFHSMLLAALDIKSSNQQPALLGFLPSAVFTVADNNGLIITSSPEKEAYRPGAVLPPALQDAIRTSSIDHGLVDLQQSGKNRDNTFAFTRTRLPGSEQWFLTHIISINEDEAFAAADASLRIHLSALILSLAAGLAVAAAISSLALLYPVRRLLDAIRQLGKGNYQARSELPRLSGELGALAKGFDGMAGAIETRNRDLMEAIQAAGAASKAKSAFLANVSHEIRTPMNAIIGMAYLAMKTRLDPRQEAYINKIHIAANTLLGVINSILDFSKIEAGEMVLENQSFVLEEVFNNVSALLVQTADDKDVELVFSIAPDIPRLLVGDPLRLSQILLNIIGNGIKFTSHGEVSAVCCLADSSESQKPLSLANGRVPLLFTVSDSGIGMTQEQMDTLFHPFSQADASSTRIYGGAGLGLAIARFLIKRMGGEISIRSQPGEGTIVSFILAFEQSDAPADAPSFLGLSGTKTLIVDDNESARIILSDMLNGFKLPVTAVGSAREAYEALAKADQSASPYRLVVLDWRMPEISGIEAAEHIRGMDLSHTPPIILVTAFGRGELQDQAERAGIRHVVYKPVSASRMFNAVLEAVESAKPAGRKREKFDGHSGAPRFNGLRVLLVEDNPINQQIAREILEQQGVRVEIAPDGQAGVETLKSRPLDFHLVLMDLQMPVMDGYSATHAIRSELGLITLPIIAMTANAMSEERKACISAGMNDHIAKPIEVDTLFEVIGNWAPKGGYLQQTASKSVGIKDAEGVDMDVRDGYEQAASPAGGLDMAGAIGRLAGNRAVYKKAVRLFRAGIPKHIAALKNAHADRNAEALRRAAHTIKGLAATIGASALTTEAKDLEYDMDDAAFFPDNTRLTRLLDALRDVEGVIAASGMCANDESAPCSAHADGADPSPHLTRLTVLLEDADADALIYFMEHKALFDKLMPEKTMRTLTGAMQRFDYDAALQLLRGAQPQCD